MVTSPPSRHLLVGGIYADQVVFELTELIDPVFFLHHTQLDRLWWKWQQVDARIRVKEYSGKAAYTSRSEAGLEDPLPLGELAGDVRVKDMMDTESGRLCYKY